MKTLDGLRGHRFFLLICVVVLPFVVKALLADGDDLAAMLSFIGGVIRDAGIGYGASKAGDAAIHYSRRGHDDPR